MKHITVILIMLISTLGPSSVIAFVGYKSVEALGRNPSAAAKILISMLLAFIFAEVIAVLGILSVFMLYGHWQ
ncbi:ATP synthase F0 subunit C [bacterium]|jgi:F0F1-type ATP synthase membrane subunit c/vacuolar-type H+-ATPase subunit K|nr:ATP synthase F0 subunit C [bacterium]